MRGKTFLCIVLYHNVCQMWLQRRIALSFLDRPLYGSTDLSFSLLSRTSYELIENRRHGTRGLLFGKDEELPGSERISCQLHRGGLRVVLKTERVTQSLHNIQDHHNNVFLVMLLSVMVH